MNSSIDHAIEAMNTSYGNPGDQNILHNTRSPFKRSRFSWSDHVQSWIKQTSFPVYVARYGDLITDSVTTFSSVLRDLKIEMKEENIIKLVDSVGLEKYAKRSGNWINELTKQQAQSILDHHSEVMKEYGYHININEHYT